MATRVDEALVDAQNEAGEDVRGEGGEDQGLLEREGLVVGPCEEEVGLTCVEVLGE